MADDATAQPAWMRPLILMFLAAVSLVLFIWFFSAISTVILGVLAATIVACTLSPVLHRFPLYRGLAAAVLGLALIASAGGLALALSLPLAGPISRELAAWPQTKVNVDALLVRWSADLKIDEKLTSDRLLIKLTDFFPGSVLLSGSASAALAILLWLAFVFVGSIFLLASPANVLVGPALRVVSAPYRADVLAMVDHLGVKLRWWMLGTIGGMCVVFSASCAGYAMAGVKFFLPLALLAGLAEIVPTVGPACAAIVALIFAASQGGGAVLGVVLTYITVQSLEAYLILPLIMRGAVQIHPAVTLFSVVLWAKIFGVPGTMLAIPINLVIASVVEFLYVRPRERRHQERQRNHVSSGRAE